MIFALFLNKGTYCLHHPERGRQVICWLCTVGVYTKLSSSAGPRTKYSPQNMAWKLLTSPSVSLLALVGGHRMRRWQIWGPLAFPQGDTALFGHIRSLSQMWAPPCKATVSLLLSPSCQLGSKNWAGWLLQSLEEFSVV